MSELGRNEDLALTCEYDGCEEDCPNECSTCAIAIKTDGDTALIENKLPSAIRFYKRALFLEPRFAEAWNNLANVYNMINEPHNALEAFDKAIAIDDEYGKALFSKAMTLRNLGRLDDAMQLANDILDLYSADEVLAFKKELIAEGVEDTRYILENKNFINALENRGYDVAEEQGFLNGKEFYDAIYDCGDIYYPDGFIEPVLEYCRRKYKAFGEEKILDEAIITSFYAAICVAVYYSEDESVFDEISQFEHLQNHIDLEFTDATAERLLNTKEGEEKAEYIWGIVSDYVKFARGLFKIATKLTDDVVLCAMKNAYEIGLLTAFYYINKLKTSETISANVQQELQPDNRTRNTQRQSEHKIISTKRKVMTQGFPSDYYFGGNDKIESKTIDLLTPLPIDVADALVNGVRGRKEWWGSKCFIIAETTDYLFYNYGCYEDGSGGCNLRQSIANPKQVVFFGKSREMGCVFHDHLVQVSRSEYGTELYLWTKHIHTGKERIYPWFGKYAIPTGRGSRYDQDRIVNMRIDCENDSIIIEVNREFCEFADNTDEEYICNADTSYTLEVKYLDGVFEATAYYPELNVTQVFVNVY